MEGTCPMDGVSHYMNQSFQSDHLLIQKEVDRLAQTIERSI